MAPAVVAVGLGVAVGGVRGPRPTCGRARRGFLGPVLRVCPWARRSRWRCEDGRCCNGRRRAGVVTVMRMALGRMRDQEPPADRSRRREDGREHNQSDEEDRPGLHEPTGHRGQQDRAVDEGDIQFRSRTHAHLLSLMGNGDRPRRPPDGMIGHDSRIAGPGSARDGDPQLRQHRKFGEQLPELAAQPAMEFPRHKRSPKGVVLVVA